MMASNQTDKGAPDAVRAGERVELSERERQILILVATGAGNKLIAQQLDISPNTVKVHLRNIFAKIGVASRTEAALYAIREGVVELPPGAAPPILASEDLTGAAAPGAASGAPDQAAVPAGLRPARSRAVGWLAALVVVLVLAMAAVIARPVLAPGTTTPPTPTALQRWQARESLPAARKGLAAATYENLIYILGGEGASGVTAAVDRYDPAADTWHSLAPMPVAVADVSAAVAGGLVFVPGGRLASGQPTAELQVYDPRTDAWESRAPLPAALSGYALVAYEGRLYVFGGWDGEAYVATVYEYDPREDDWTEATAMPTARAFAGAAVAAGRIYVIGGADAHGPLAANEEFQPSSDLGEAATPWRRRRDLPEPRSGLGMASVADLVMAVEGRSGASPYSMFQYLPQPDTWAAFEVEGALPRHNASAAIVGTQIFVLGGQRDGAPVADNAAYQVIFNVLLPIVQ